jgi:hypothetical protein
MSSVNSDVSEIRKLAFDANASRHQSRAGDH